METATGPKNTVNYITSCKTEVQDNNFWPQSDLQDGDILWRSNTDDRLTTYPMTDASSKLVIVQGDSSAAQLEEEQIIILPDINTSEGCFVKTEYCETIDVERDDSEIVDVGMPLPAPIIHKPKKRAGKKRKDTSGLTSLTDTSEPESGHEYKNKLNEDELTKLEDNWEQVAERFKEGCECFTSNCFAGLNPERVFRHRLNIAELTKAEHDMYLMGVILASMQNQDETIRKKERMRLRSSYSYQGKKVCLMAFLYLEHVTLYQMKRIRKHLQLHGVSPRIHGNHGRNPANTLPLAIYQHATTFVKRFINQHHIRGTTSPNRVTSYRLPSEWNCKTVHEEYKNFCETSNPSHKPMQYSTFTSFFKKQFPYVRFAKQDSNRGNRKEKPKGKTKQCQVSAGDIKNVTLSQVLNVSYEVDTKPYIFATDSFN